MSTPNKTPTTGGSTPAATRTPAAGGSAPAAAASNVQTIDIRVPKNINKKLAIMRFNGSMGIDFVQWKDPKMERENNQVQFKGFNEDMPKFGAGSEYGREAREEARRKKYGIISKKYNPENQPWILQHGGKSGKKFRGVRDGGINENASYYVFTQAPDGVFDAFPVQEQYSFQAVQNYKPLSIEEAEEGYNMRNKTYNMFNVMMRKRLRKDEDLDEEGEEEGEGKGKSKKKKGSKDSRFGDELDDMMASSDDDSSDGNDDNDDDDGESKKKKKKGKKPVKPKKKRKNASDDEALEDSDDGDGEGRELDYISSSDDDESDFEKEEAKDGLKGVAEEDALRKLLNSDEEDEDEEKEEEEDKDKEEEDAEGAEDQQGDKASKDEKGDKKKKKDKKKNKDKKPRNEDYGSSSDSGAESSASELEKAKPSPKVKPGSANSSRSATPTKPETSPPKTTLSDSKRKGTPAAVSDALTGQAPKKPRLDMASAATAASVASAASSSSANEGVNEESVRRYLSRKPMTTTELLQKFKSKKTGLSSDQLVHHIAQILKKINPVKQTIKGKMYLSIKA